MVDPQRGRLRSWQGPRTVGGQVFIILVLVAAAVAALLLESRADAEREARNRTLEDCLMRGRRCACPRAAASSCTPTASSRTGNVTSTRG